MTTLDMAGHIDSDFESHIATRTPDAGTRVNGVWTSSDGTPDTHSVTLQNLREKELDVIARGGERIIDARKMYVNDGDLYSISPSDIWTFPGISGSFKSVAIDNRPWRNYCKIILSRVDS